MLTTIGHTRVALKHKKTDLSLETSSEINFEFIKFVKISKLSPFVKNKLGILNVLVVFDLSRVLITFFCQIR